jgi:hypothetical protein
MVVCLRTAREHIFVSSVYSTYANKVNNFTGAVLKERIFMQNLQLYVPDSFLLGLIAGFFLMVGLYGMEMPVIIFDFNIHNLYSLGNRLLMLICLFVGVYVFYYHYLNVVGYFAAILIGALAGQLFIIIFSILGTPGRVFVYLTGFAAVFAVGAAAWLYYIGELARKIGTIDLLKYFP